MLYAFAHILVSILARALLRFRVIGLQNVPLEGGAIIAANHASYFDIPLLGCALKRKADFLGKAELFRNPIVRFFFRRLGGIPIKRGKADRAALSELVKRLQSGRLVVYYPEGTRSASGSLQLLKPGIGLVASQARVPIVPACIEGTARMLHRWFRRPRRHPVVIRFGPPLDPTCFGDKDLGDEKNRYHKISQGVQEAIAGLRSPNAQPVREEQAVQT